jgi:hypothetical protein
MVGSLASLFVEWWVHYGMLHCGMVEGWARRTSSKQERLPNTERVDDSEEEAAEYRRHDKRVSYFECDCDSVDFSKVERMESHG